MTITRRAKWVLRVGIALVLLGAAAVVTFFVVIHTDWFKEKVRQRIIAEVEKSTGGRVEIGGFTWHDMTAEMTRFVVHGKEGAGAAPLFTASKIEIGAKIVSLIKQQVDIESLNIDQPQIHVYENPDGTNNLPMPPGARSHAVTSLLDLKVRRLAITNGSFDYAAKHIPLDLRADNLAANVRYLPNPARYEAELSSHQFHITTREFRNAAFDLDAKVALEENHVDIHRANLSYNHSSIEFTGTVPDLATLGADLTFKTHLHLVDFAETIKLPVQNRGDLGLEGKASFMFNPFAYRIEGQLNGRDLAFVSKDLKLPSFTIVSKMVMKRDGIDLTNAEIAALDGHFRGGIAIDGREHLRVNGAVEGISVQQLATLQGLQVSGLSGSMSGPVEAEGLIGDNGIEDVKTHSTFQIAPGGGGMPVEGSVEVDYDERAGILQFGNWNLTMGTSKITASGILGQTLDLHVTSRNLNDLAAAFPLVGEKIPEKLPVQLVRGGGLQFDGTMRGPLNSPTLSGQLKLTNFETANRQFNQLVCDCDANRSHFYARALSVDSDILHATARGELALDHWAPTPQSPLQASVSVRGIDVARLEIGGANRHDFAGALSGTGAITGTFGTPVGSGHVEVDNASGFGETFTRVAADLNFTGDNVEVSNGRASLGKAQADFSGIYRHSATDWTSGQLRFKVATRGYNIAQVKAISNLRQGLDGQLDAQATGEGHFVKGDFQLDDLDARGTVRTAVIQGRPLGSLTATAKSRGQILDVKADAELGGNPVHGEGEWQLTGNDPGHGVISIPRMTLSTLNDLLLPASKAPLPFGGFLSAKVNVSGPLKDLGAFRADVNVSEMQVNASPDTQPRAGAQAGDLVLRNIRPLEFAIASKRIEIRSAQFSGVDTTLQASGSAGFGEKGALNLRINGSINLAILQLFNPDLLASGISPLNVAVRGTFDEPDMSGQLQMRNASLFLGDLPTGVEHANGNIVFDRNRATIEKLTGESGGGSIVFDPGSFVGFSGPTLIYRVEATADHVRYRTQDGLSVTAKGDLRLSGTSASSILSGTVTLMRATLSAQTDVGSLLASTAKPVSLAAAPNAYVRGIQFDVRIDSAPNLEVVTTLTRNIQVDANLRLRGNVEHPIVLGSISVTEGEIDFFGNKYTINRGEVNFNNPVKLAPVLNMDLETRVRGITIDITFAGPLDKLSFSYRSDPPLESSQIIALLAVGREPVGLGNTPGGVQVATNTSYLATGTNQILQQAITAPVSGRLQRFFGVSHIKIDPQISDITSVPQARLSFEQQISKDITLTYITNLSRTSEQIVRIEWSLSTHWSLIAVRDENGLFGMDFQYRKTFK